VFDEVTKKEGGKRAARRSAFVAGSSVVQVLLVLFVIVMGERIRAAVKSEPVVEVKFVKAALPPPPPPPPPPPAAKKRPPSEKPKVDVVRPPPTAMIQPKDVVEEAKANPNEPEDEDYGDADGGTEGGVVGGVVGGQRGPQQIEEAPRYMMSGFKAPQLAEKSCIAENLRIPSQLAGFVSGPITVKFAVYASAAVSDVQIMAQLPDPRIGEAIKNAIRGCQWIPGADAQGKPTSIWVIMPIRFAGN
jgi:protein TonB